MEKGELGGKKVKGKLAGRMVVRSGPELGRRGSHCGLSNESKGRGKSQSEARQFLGNAES